VGRGLLHKHGDKVIAALAELSIWWRGKRKQKPTNEQFKKCPEPERGREGEGERERERERKRGRIAVSSFPIKEEL
jgi:hypothetical protein